MKRFLIYLRSRPLALASVTVLILFYLTMIFAEFIAPYGANTSFPEYTSHPPNARFHKGRFMAQEHRIINTVNWKYVRIKDHYTDIQFFGKGEPHKLWGFIPMERHLFTAGNTGSPDAGYPVFLMGTDTLGRDLFSRIIYGSRISLTIGFIATAISLLLAIFFGGLAGYFGGAADWSVMRLAEFLMLIPSLYLILFLRSLFLGQLDSGQSYMMITLILSLVGWPGSARTLRGMIHSVKREEFILNAQLEMIPSFVIIFRHIIPQIASLLIVSIALSIPGFIMTETTLSYLGLGIADPAVSWGSLIRRDISTLANLRAFPWLLSPVWFLLGVTLGFNFLGDALRDYFDPYHTVFRKKKWNRQRKNVIPVSRLPDSPSLLEVRDLRVTFSVLRGKEVIAVQAVRGVSFSLERGKVLGIVGESGSGKSVSTQAIPGLLPHNAGVSGEILYRGENLLDLSPNELRAYRGKRIGMIFQEPGRSYDPLQTIGKAFLETFRNCEPEISKEAALDRAATLLNEVGLGSGRERLSNYPHQFSGGQLQRINIALALAQGCELLIADEPTTALDVTIQKQLIDLLKELRAKRQISIIFISHDIDLVADISDRVLVMYGGLVMEMFDTAAGLVNAVHPYTRALLAASPRFGSHYTKERLKVIPGKMADPVNPEPGCPFAPRCPAENDETGCRARVPELIAINGKDDEVKAGHYCRCIKGNFS